METFEKLGKKMLQVGMSGAGGPSVLRIEETGIPEPKPHEVLIEVYAAGVNRPDIAQREGRYPPPPGASPVLGLEVAGVIVAKGAQVNEWSIGEQVCALAPGGGYAQFCAAPASHCLPIPQGFSWEEAAGIPETFFTVWANVFQIAKLKRSERFLVHGGTSGIGTTAIQLARAFGAEVFATAGSDEKCAACLKLGATHAIQYKRQDFEEEIARLTEKRGVDVILDMVAGPYTEKNLRSLGMDGRLVNIAALQGAQVTLNVFSIMQKRIVFTGSTLRPRTIEQKARIAQELKAEVWPLLESRKVQVVVDRVFPLQDVIAAHEYLEAGQHVGKIILKMKDSN